MASLTIVVDGAPQKYPLGNPAVTLGRGLESDVRLKDIKASRRHCQVVRTPKGYQCVDLSSGNGTYLNGVQIKSQMLESGDKITIGSTTIVFEDTAPAAAEAKAPPAPAARPPEEKPVSSKTATAKIPTARVQSAPTRKVTARVEAVKTASTASAKPATAPASKSGTRLARPSARGATAGRPARPAAEAPRKKSPLILGGVAAAVLLAGGAGYYFFAGRDNGEQVRAQIDQLMKKGKDAEEAGQLPAALKEYTKALELCQGDRHKVRASEIRTLLQQIEARRSSSGAPPKSDPKDPSDKGPDPATLALEISRKYKLSGEASAADWGGAVKEWKELAAKKPAAEIAAKAQAEIKGIQEKAREDLDRLRKKAEALAQENKMAEAVSVLKQQLPRFQNTDWAAELEAAIKQYDK